MTCLVLNNWALAVLVCLLFFLMSLLNSLIYSMKVNRYVCECLRITLLKIKSKVNKECIWDEISLQIMYFCCKFDENRITTKEVKKKKKLKTLLKAPPFSRRLAKYRHYPTRFINFILNDHECKILNVWSSAWYAWYNALLFSCFFLRLSGCQYTSTIHLSTEFV